jgi:hypothetical protein
MDDCAGYQTEMRFEVDAARPGGGRFVCRGNERHRATVFEDTIF